MMIRVLLAATVALLLPASPAAAHWQWTKWGMSPAEVTAASGGRATPGQNDTLTMTGPVTVGGIEFDRAYFGFDAGRLKQVTLATDDASFSQAEWALAAALGEPVVVDNTGRPVRVFVDRPAGNSIRLTGDVDGSTLVYSPIPTGF